MTGLKIQEVGSFNLKNSNFRYEPFPIALAKNIFADELYHEMLENWPDIELFRYMPNLGHKYSLSEVNNASQYHKFIKSTPVWQRFFNEIKDEKFTLGILDFLTGNNIDLGFGNKCMVTNKPALNIWTRLREAYRGAALLGSKTTPLKSRFEFSMLPGDGGSIRPHTDAQTKFITLAVAMVRKDEWQESYGGGTSVLWPKDATKSYNAKNEYLEFDQTNELETYQFGSNQCVIFVKTFNSWHAVQPIQAPKKDIFRKSLTINIETPRG